MSQGVGPGCWDRDEYGVGNFHLNLMSADLPNGTYDIQVALNPLNNQGCTVVATAKFTLVTVHS